MLLISHVQIDKMNYNICAKCTIAMLEKETNILFEMITNNTDIDSFNKKVSTSIFDNPVMITNSFFKVVTMHTSKQFNDEVWEYGMKHHCCSKESIMAFHNDKASSVLFNSNEAFIYDTNLGEQIPRILCRIANNSAVFGYLIIFEVNHKLGKEDLLKANLVSKALSVLLSNIDNDALANSRREYFYRKLVDVETSNLLDLENEIEQFNWDFKKYFKVLSIVSSNQSHFVYLCNEINMLSDNLTAFVYNTQMVVIINYLENNNLNFYLQEIYKIIGEYNCVVGISRSFLSLRKLRIYLRQAVNARQYGVLLKEEHNYFHYSRYQYYDMLMHYDKQEWSSLLSREYLILKDYDSINNTDLTSTCIAYYLEGLKVSKASEVLHIHRNTLMYRLETIKEIINCDVNDVQILDSIYHSNMIDKLIEATK